MKKRYLVAGIVLIVIIAVFVIWVGYDFPSWPVYISASEERPWSRSLFDKLTAPGKTYSIETEKFLKTVFTNVTSDAITVEHPIGAKLRDLTPSDVTILPLNGGKASDGASVRIKCIGTALSEQPLKRGEVVKAPLKFYRPDGSILSEKEIRKILPQDHESEVRFFSSWRRRMRFYLDISGLTDVEIAGTNCLERNMKTIITRGTVSHSENELYYVEHNLSVMHSPSALLLVDLAYGETETVNVAPLAGSEAEFSNTTCRVEAFMAGMSWGGHDSRGKYKNFTIDAKYKDRTILVISRPPNTFYSQFDITLITHEGKQVTPDLEDYSNIATMQNYRIKQDEIKSIRITYKPQIRRFLIPVEKIPGTPEENSDIENLLNVTVPAVRFERENEINSFLGNMLGLHIWKSVRSSSAKTFFPKEYKNAKVGEILQDYLDLYPKAEVNFKEGEFLLEIKTPKTRTEKIQKYLQEIWPF